MPRDQRPAGLTQQQVDEVVAGLGLRIVMRVRLLGARLLRFGHFGPQAVKLVVEHRFVNKQSRQHLAAVAQLALKLLEPFDGLLGNRRSLRKRCRVEGKLRIRFGTACIRVCEPVPDVEQLADRHRRIGLLDAPMAVHRLVAELIDDPRLAKNRVARRRFEARLVDQSAQVVLVGQTYRSIGLVDPSHCQLERTSGVEGGRTRIRVNRRFRLTSRFVDCGPFSLEEVEVAHASAPLPI